VFFYRVSHLLEHYIVSVFQKPAQLDIIRVNHDTSQNMILECGVDFSLDKRLFVATRVLSTKVHNLIATLHLRSSPPRIVYVQQRGADAWHNILELLIASATRNTPSEQRPDRIASGVHVPRSLLVFHVFFTVFKSLLDGTLARDSFTYVALYI